MAIVWRATDWTESLLMTRPVFEARTDDEVRALFPVVVQLRQHLTGPDDLVTRVAGMRAGGFRLVWTADEAGEPVAVAGFRTYETLYAGLKLYVDDLVTTQARRGKGDGTVLMNWLVAEAGRLGCSELDLDSGVQRAGAHAFYFARGMHVSSFHFRLKV
jgi:GNAT superfamily N-acetyltransferase